MSTQHIEDAQNAHTSTQSKPRTYQAGKRRFTFYNSWDFPAEAGADVADFDNRYPTTLEFRRLTWPALEWMRAHDQGVANQIEHGVLKNYNTFREFMGEVTEQPVPLIQRVDKA